MQKLSGSKKVLQSTTALSKKTVLYQALTNTSSQTLFSPAIVVTNTNDEGAGSLREAINTANQNAGPDVITFNIPGNEAHTISISSSLPQITDQLTIDGYSQSGAIENTANSPMPFNGTLKINIDGSSMPNGTGSCLIINGANNTIIRGLVIGNCSNSGIEIGNSNYLAIEGNYIGTDITGMNAATNGRSTPTVSYGYGIFANASNHMRIGGLEAKMRNIVAANMGGDIFWGNEGDSSNPSEYNVLQGNYIGSAADGVKGLPSGWQWGLGNAVLMGNSHNDLLGGTDPTAKNVIGSSWEFGISFRDGCSNTLVQGNYVGTDYTSNHPMVHSLGSGHPTAGVHISTVSNANFTRASHDIIVGGSSVAARNVISGNSYVGSHNPTGLTIRDGGYNNTVIGNAIGTNVTGEVAVPNEGNGVAVEGKAYNNRIGGIAEGEENIIAYNNEQGIADYGDGAFMGTNVNNSFLKNKVYQNKGIGIDLAYWSSDPNINGQYFGPTPNDAGDSDSGANKQLNYPQITKATKNTTNEITVNYNLDEDNQSQGYHVEFYINSKNNFEAEKYAGSAELSSSGSYTIKLNVPSELQNLETFYLTATATEKDASTDGYGSTSELSIPQIVSDSSTEVTNTNDSGPGSLRQAINIANSKPGQDRISFDIEGDGEHKINLMSPLPDITDSIIIDGFSQKGSMPNSLISENNGINANLNIVINGTNIVGNLDGLRIIASNSAVKGLVVQNFKGAGILVIGNNNSIAGNYIGCDRQGLQANPNRDGIFIQSGDNNIVGGYNPADRNLASGNSGNGIAITNGNLNKVFGNIVGLQSNGMVGLGNGFMGIILGHASDNQVGSADTNTRNVISANAVNGVVIFSYESNLQRSSRNKIQGNYIGINVLGQLDNLGNGYAGAGIGGNGTDNLIGGVNQGEGNIIAGNKTFAGAGAMVMRPLSSDKNSFVGNSIFSNNGMSIDLMEGTTTSGGPTSQIGRTPNDIDDQDTGGANDYLNYPEITSVIIQGSKIIVHYNLDVSDNHPGVNGYRLEFFGNPGALPANDSMDAHYLIGSQIVYGDVHDGIFEYNVPTESNGPIEGYITMTNTELDNSTDGFGGTSEVSNPVTAVNSNLLSILEKTQNNYLGKVDADSAKYYLTEIKKYNISIIV